MLHTLTGGRGRQCSPAPLVRLSPADTGHGPAVPAWSKVTESGVLLMRRTSGQLPDVDRVADRDGSLMPKAARQVQRRRDRVASRLASWRDPGRPGWREDHARLLRPGEQGAQRGDGRAAFVAVQAGEVRSGAASSRVDRCTAGGHAQRADQRRKRAAGRHAGRPVAVPGGSVPGSRAAVVQGDRSHRPAHRLRLVDRLPHGAPRRPQAALTSRPDVPARSAHRPGLRWHEASGPARQSR